jgi:predicted O-methyltransferase YrrM
MSRQQSSASKPLPLNLPVVPQSQLDVRLIDWSGLSRRFMNEGELEVLIALVRSVGPRAVLEFGVNEGRTAKAILQNVDGIETYQGIDVLPGYVTAMPVQRKEVPARPGWIVADDARFELILRKNGSRDLTTADLKPCDAAFIDGDHGWQGVLHDTLLCQKLVRPGGVVIWHDYHGQGTVDVRDVLELVQAHGVGIQHVEKTWLAFLRV